MSEADLQQRILDLARLTGWMVVHFRPARTERGWRTPVQGNAGFPDLVLAKDGQVVVAELKSDRGHPSLEQVAWLQALGEHGRVWRPRDWAQIQDLLTGRTKASDDAANTTRAPYPAIRTITPKGPF